MLQTLSFIHISRMNLNFVVNSMYVNQISRICGPFSLLVGPIPYAHRFNCPGDGFVIIFSDLFAIRSALPTKAVSFVGSFLMYEQMRYINDQI